jgi:DNA-binding CsgD family transcriptional regulator
VLVGRAAERQAIDRLLAAARLGTSGALVVTGDPGVGKTALVETALSELEGVRLLRATGLEPEREVAFAALLQLLRPTLALLDTIPAAQAEAVATALSMHDRSPGGRRAPDRFAIGAGVLALLCRYAEDGPVAVVIDDLHLLDAPSADAVVFATRRLGADPVAVLATARSPEVDDLVTGLPTMRLDGLDLADTRELVLTRRGDGLTDDRLALLHRVTDGNPLALLELTSTDLDTLEGVPTGMPLRVPTAVTAAFARRLEVLDTSCRAALLVAAVCGGDLRVTCAACAFLDVDPSSLGDAEDAGLVSVRADRVDFRHPLLRAAAYSGAGARERREAHRAVAEVLPTEDVERRAWHLSEAVWHPDVAVSGLLADAAESAAARAAYAVASTAYARSARLTPDPDARTERILRAAETAWLAGESRRALGLLDRYAMDSPGAAGSVRELELRGAVAARTGSLRHALELLAAAADRADNPEDRAVLLADAVHAAFYLGDARVADGLASELAGLLSSLRTPRARALGLMATGIARILAGHGGVAEIRAAVPLLETTPDLRDDPRRLPWLMLAPLFLRDATGGVRLRAVVDEVRGSGGIGTMPALLFHVARDQATTDAWALATANYLESIRLAGETGQATEEAMSLAGLAWLESHQGNEPDCRHHAARARSLCAGRDLHFGEAWTSFALGDLELSLGNPAPAVDELTGLVTLLERQGIADADLSPGPELVDALLRTGRAEEAATVAEGFATAAGAKGQPWALARAARVRGLLAADTGIDEPFQQALHLHTRTLDRFEGARTMLAYGERLRRAGRRVDARTQLRGALEAFDHLGAARWSERAASELAATGEQIVRTGTGVVSALTPQELQVSLLLAEGRTTREAAAALFLSPKTVEYHLRKVYTKLGVRSRADLAGVLEGLAEQPPTSAAPPR